MFIIKVGEENFLHQVRQDGVVLTPDLKLAERFPSQLDAKVAAQYLPENTQYQILKVKLSYKELGHIMLREAGTHACLSGYGTVDPDAVGRFALQYRDINPDGSLN